MEGGDVLAALKPVPQRRNGGRSRSPRGESDRAQLRLQDPAEIATGHGLLVLADAAHESIAFDGWPFPSLPQCGEVADRQIGVQTLSNDARQGRVAARVRHAPKELAPTFQRVHGP